MPFLVRSLMTDDIPRLAALWYERMSLIAPQATPILNRPVWESRLTGWLGNADCWCMGVEDESLLVGGIITQQVKNRAIVRDLSLDLHRYQAGAGRQLVKTARAWAVSRGIDHLLVPVARASVVEQAFWVSLGAMQRPAHQEDRIVFWLKAL